MLKEILGSKQIYGKHFCEIFLLLDLFKFCLSTSTSLQTRQQHEPIWPPSIKVGTWRRKRSSQQNSPHARPKSFPFYVHREQQTLWDKLLYRPCGTNNDLEFLYNKPTNWQYEWNPYLGFAEVS